jgi:hypothetical protein
MKEESTKEKEKGILFYSPGELEETTYCGINRYTFRRALALIKTKHLGFSGIRDFGEQAWSYTIEGIERRLQREGWVFDRALGYWVNE